jgi:hypothetical protein
MMCECGLGKIHWWAVVFILINLPDSIKGNGFIDHVNNHQLLKKNSDYRLYCQCT